MRVLNVTAENFCSYKYLSFSVEERGLCLVSGETGSGKSTMFDAVSWGLFGITSKEGASDDVRAWDAAEPTTAYVTVDVKGQILTVCRIRGPKNDLYWLENGTGDEIRGKDLSDTRRLLEQRLGVTAELFLLGSYLTQFSKADSFFIAKAKDRRVVLERIADQEFPIKLAERTSEARKVAKKELTALEIDLAGVQGKIEGLKESFVLSTKQAMSWEEHKAAKLLVLRDRLESFDEEHARTIAAIKKKSLEWQAANARKVTTLHKEKASLGPYEAVADIQELITDLEVGLSLEEECPTCGAADSKHAREIKQEIARQQANIVHSERIKDKHDALNAQIKRIEAEADPHLSGLQQAQRQANPYAEQIDALKAETNPHTKRLLDARTALQTLQTRCSALQATLTDKSALIASLTWLYDKSYELRSLLMARVVAQVESMTNKTLERHFDAALRVKFLLEDSDKLDVEISNDGHVCGFKALSGGERTILKLAFSLSLMRAAQDKAGVSFGQVFLDEPLTGLSTDLKVKAFGLFQELEADFGNVFVIEHSEEFKAQFSNTYVVTKTSGHSEIHESQGN